MRDIPIFDVNPNYPVIASLVLHPGHDDGSIVPLHRTTFAQAFSSPDVKRHHYGTWTRIHVYIAW
jgi:hypothetical protein